MVFVGLGLCIVSYVRQEHFTMEVMAAVVVAEVVVGVVGDQDIVAMVKVVGDQDTVGVVAVPVVHSFARNVAFKDTNLSYALAISTNNEVPNDMDQGYMYYTAYYFIYFVVPVHPVVVYSVVVHSAAASVVGHAVVANYMGYSVDYNVDYSVLHS